MSTGYYKTVVKIKEEHGWNKKKGEAIYKTVTENYIVEAGSPQAAADKTEKEMDGCMGEWRIDSVKEVKITKII